LLLLVLASSGCLGEDWKTFPLGAGAGEQGWLLQVEPDEEFDVGLLASALYPDLPWTVAQYDPAVIELADTLVEDRVRAWGDWDMSAPEDEPQMFLPIHLFFFRGVSNGQTPLVLELRNGDELVEVLEVTVSVVDDACAGDEGLRAPRCGRDFRDEIPSEDVEGFGLFEEWDHGWLVNMEPGDRIVIRLAGNAVHPDAPWQVAESDPAVIEIADLDHDTAVRDPQDWDISDASKPTGFVATTSITIEAEALGQSPLVLEVLDGTRRVDVYELVISVTADACATDTDTGLTPCHN
jgi:hypothetical protein